MTVNSRLMPLGLMVLLPTLAVSQPQTASPDPVRTMAELVVAAYNDDDPARLFSQFNAEMKAAVPSAQLDETLDQIRADLGNIVELDPATKTSTRAAVFPVRLERGALEMSITLDADGKIAGLLLRPARPALPVPDRNETPLLLPFVGAWYCFWGGDDSKTNAHHDVPNQRFAFDFLGVGPDGKTSKPSPQVNEDFYCFGREILAPADGIVTDVIEGVRDNVPGSLNPYSALGNAVFIQHSEHEVSVLAHLKLGSVRVKVGDEVKAGQVIGLCGNSGNSSEPHLHYHLQNTPIIQDATGIKCFFRHVQVVRKGKPELHDEYSPVKGDIISTP